MSELNSRPTPDTLEEATGALREVPVPPGPPTELMAATVAAIHNRLAGAVPAEHVRRERRKRIMRYMGFGSAVAAMVAAAIVLWSPGRSSAEMFDRAIENAEKARSFRTKITTTAGEMTFEMKMYGQGDRFRNEMDMGKDLGGFVIVVDGKDKKGLQLNTPAKTAKWLDLSKPDKNQEVAMKDAAGVSGLFADLKGKKLESLPDETVDGRKLKVFAAKGHKLAGSKGEADITVWIDPKTEFPVRTRTEMTVNGVKAVAVMEFLGWNEELDAKLFEMKVPEGYKLIEEPKKDSPEPDPGRTAFINFIRPALENAEKAKSVKIVATTEKDGKTEHNYTLYRDGDLLRRDEGKNIKQGDYEVLILNLKSRETLFLKTKEKTAQRFLYPEDGTKQIKEIVASDFKMGKEYADLVGATLKDLGEEKIGDRITRTYTLTSPKLGKTQVWVDPKTQLPARIHFAGDDGKLNMTIDFEKWNEELDAKLFEMKVPAGYKLIDPPVEKK